MNINIPAGSSSGPITSSGVLKGAEGQLLGVLVSSTSSGTIKLWDNATAASGTVLIDTFTPAGTGWFPLPFQFKNGCYVTIGGTISAAFSFI